MDTSPDHGRGKTEPPTIVARGTALFLDVDGTLAPIEPVPGAVRPTRRRTRLLRELGDRLGGRIAAISGRPIGEIDRILGGAVGAVAGLHGLERRSAAAGVFTVAPHPALSCVLARFRALADERDGLLVEAKGAAVAVHYRRRPDLAEEVTVLARALCASSGLDYRPGAMVSELRTPGPHKGDAVRAFMAEPPFADARPIFVGDDLTDEDGFTAARALGGFGVLVGPDRPSAATYRIADVEAVLAWLATAPEDAAQPRAATHV